MSDLGGIGYTLFERELLFAVFDASTRAAALLRLQVAQSEVTTRRYTGVGSYTDIEVDRSAPTVRGVCTTPAEQRDVAIWRPGLTLPAGCVVFIDDEGFLNCLEVYTFGDEWNDEPPRWLIVDATAEPTSNPFSAKPN